MTGRREWLTGLIFVAVLVACATLLIAAPPTFPDGKITPAQLDAYLSRAITMEGLLTDHGDLDDQIRLLRHINARFAGRTIYLWGGEKNLDAALLAAKPREEKIHAAIPDLILQAAIFEIVTVDVEKYHIPREVAGAFNAASDDRPFAYQAMLSDSGKLRNHWGKGSSVPDITKLETQMWFYYLARRYIDLGVEAIHFGQVDLIGQQDKDHAAWDKVLTEVRKYAAQHARRKIVLCDGHVPRGGLLVGNRLLLDFHSFPLRIAEGADVEEGILHIGHSDSLYGRSKGGTTPSGWTCEHLPYLVEFDNFGRSRKEGKKIGAPWIWGYDEITWFAHLPPEKRAAFLHYADQWLTDHDPAGHVQMPGSRTIAVRAGDANWYWASDKSPLSPMGFGDETTIAEIWNAKEKVKQ